MRVTRAKKAMRVTKIAKTENSINAYSARQTGGRKAGGAA